MRLKDDEKEAVRELVEAWTTPLPDDPDDMDLFWWNYGSDQASDLLPWGDDPPRAQHLHCLAQRVQRRYCREAKP